MNRHTFIVVLVSLLALTGRTQQPVPVADPKPFLDDLAKKMASVSTVYLEFTQERVLKLFNEPLTAEGVMLIARPGLIRWENTSPYESILLGNEKSVAQFERNGGKWEKLKIGFPQMLQRVMKQMTLLNQGRLDAMTADYTVSVATGEVAVVNLVPKDANIREMLASLEITLKPDFSATMQVQMNEPNGDYTRIRFRNEKRDAKFPDATFDQTKPMPVATVKETVNRAP